MRIHSKHSAKTYLSELRHSLVSIFDFDFWSERFTGFIIGSFFCVTHHCDHELNRRINGETVTAIGIVKQSDDGCNVRFFTIWGEFRPQGLFMLLCFELLYVIFYFTLGHISLNTSHMPIMIGAIFAIGLLCASISALISWLTENGQAGYQSLISLLLDPANPYDNL